MARWDVYRNCGPRGGGDTPYLLDVQAEMFSHLQSRLVVPLRTVRSSGTAITRLQPIVWVAGAELVMDTPMMVGAPTRWLGERVTSLAGQAPSLLAAIDFLLTGS